MYKISVAGEREKMWKREKQEGKERELFNFMEIEKR